MPTFKVRSEPVPKQAKASDTALHNQEQHAECIIDPPGRVANVRDEENYTEVIRSLAPIDHLIYSGVDKIIRGAIAEADLDDAKHYFGVKFWGSAMTGKSESVRMFCTEG